jgi:hypothetical protein
MIKKSIIVAVILLLAYEAVIRLSAIKWDTSQNDKSVNLISAQNFIYNISDEEVKTDTIILGSSISRKLVTNMLGKNYYNLAFNAWSAFDGLELIKLTGKKPACLLIETNVMSNQPLPQDIKDGLSPVSYYPNKIFKSLQLQNQPVGLIVGAVKENLKERMEEMKRKKRENQQLYDYNLKLEKEKQMKTFTDSEYEARFEMMKTLVEEFRKQHVQVIFFEIPFDPQLENTVTIEKNRRYFKQYFPEAEYRHIGLPAVNNYVYSDGLHLSVQSAPEYTTYLKNEIDKLKNK